MIKTCTRCHKTFECQHNSNCRCSKYVLSEAAKEYLKTHFEDCLCESCLKEIHQLYKDI